jgi:1-deoxy-D-xylulose-5-phosphate synthase
VTTTSEPLVAGHADLLGYSPARLGRLATDIREFLIRKVSAAGGHLGPNLGAVELTIALHRVFRSPHDMLLFDTGHQAYVHKILTGRQADFDTLRQAGGISGYPSRSESEHDVIENSHASTALSYADGLAKAFALAGSDRRVVAVIGDGALTGGMCWEALNNIGAAPQRPMVIVLNDNGRSYAPTVGGIASHLAMLRYEGNSNIFKDLGLSYIGPVDGHDLPALEQALRKAVRMHRPVVVHCLTRKGKGYQAAERDEADRLHSVGPAGPAGRPTWTSVFADEIAAVGQDRPDVVCVTAAMAEPAGLAKFTDRFPDRVHDVGIAEQHAVTSAAGMAIGGLHPVVAIYSTFLSHGPDLDGRGPAQAPGDVRARPRGHHRPGRSEPPRHVGRVVAARRTRPAAGESPRPGPAAGTAPGSRRGLGRADRGPVSEGLRRRRHSGRATGGEL